MPTLLEGMAEQQRANQETSLGNLQQAATAYSLANALQHQERERAYRNELAGLGPNPTEEQYLGVVGKYVSPDVLLKAKQDFQNRREARADRAFQFAQQADMRQQQLNQQREQFNQKTQDAAAKAQFDQWYKTESLRNQQVFQGMALQLKQMGLDLTRQGQQLQLQRAEDRQRDTEEKQIEQQIGKTADRMKDVGPVFTAAKQLNDTLSMYSPDDVPGVGYLKNTDIGKAFLSDKGKDVSSSIKLFGNAVLKAMSGQAVTQPEEIRQMAAQMADGRFGAQDFFIAWPKMAQWVNDQVSLSTAGLTPKAKERFTERTGLNLAPISPRFVFDQQSGSLKDTRAPAADPLVFDGYQFPSQEKLNAYKKAKGL